MAEDWLTVSLVSLLWLSIITSLFSIYVICTKNLKKSAIRLMLYVSISDILGSLGWFISIVNSECPFLGGMVLFSFTASSIWVAFVGFNLWYTTSKPNRTLPNELYLHAIAWGCPLVLIIIGFAAQVFVQYGPPSGCWINGIIMSVVFCLPTLLCSLVNFGFLAMTISQMLKDRISSTLAPLKSKAKILLAIQSCFVLYAVGVILQIITPPYTPAFNAGMIVGALTGFFNSTAISGFSLWQKYFTKRRKRDHNPLPLP